MMNKLGDDIKQTRIEKGFYTPTGILPDIFVEVSYGDIMLGKLMLVVTEVGEAAEAVRHNNFDNFKEELADAIIRLLDIARSCGIDIDDEVLKKMKTNERKSKKF